MNERAQTQFPARRPAWLLAAGAAIFGASLAVSVAAQGQQQKPALPKIPASSKPAPEPPVKDRTAQEEDAWANEADATANQVCSNCHPVADITRTRHTWKEWNDIVAQMSAVGAQGTDEQLMTIKLYLTRYWGLVKVNSASAAELQAVLGLSSKDAAAVVDYRKAHGNFSDVASLQKVEGIDQSKITDQAEAIRFD